MSMPSIKQLFKTVLYFFTAGRAFCILKKLHLAASFIFATY